MYLFLNLVASQLISLSNFRVGSHSSLALSLPTFIPGSPFPFSLSGSYNISNSKDPLIISSFSLIETYTKKYPGSQESLLISNNILYSVWDSGLVLYNVSNPSNITILSEISYTTNSILIVYPVSLSTGNYLLSIETGGILRVLNITSGTEITAMKVTYPMINTLSCAFLIDINYVWAFPYNSSFVTVIRLDLLVTFSSSIYRSFSAAALYNATSMINFAIYQKLAYICDSAKGISVFDVESTLESPTSTPLLIDILEHPLLFGNITSCSFNENLLAVSTSQSILVYTLPFLGVNSIYQISGINFVQASASFTVGFSSNKAYVYSNLLSVTQAAIAIQSLQLNSWTIGGNTLFGNTDKTIVVYSIAIPSITFPGQSSNYQYKGTLVVNSISYPVVIIGSDMPAVIPFMGAYPGSGYLQPNTIQNYMYSSLYSLYLPLSNYYAGNDLVYSLNTTIGEAAVIDKYVVASAASYSLQFTTVSAVPEIVLLGSLTAVQILQINGILLDSTTTVIPSATSAQINGYTLYQSNLVIESYVNSDTPSVIQDYYSLKGSLLQTVNLGNIKNSSKMLASSQYLYVLRENCVDVYTAGSLVMSLCEDTILPSLTLSIVDIAICNGLCVLDANNGVLIFQYGSFAYTVLSLPNDSYTSLVSNSQYVLAFTSTEIYEVLLADLSYTTFALPCTPSLVSISYQFLSLQCSNVVIIDLYGESFANIYTQMALTGPFIVTGSQPFTGTGFSFNNGYMTVYSIGFTQQSALLPTNNNMTGSWGSISLSTPDKVVEGKITITASQLGAQVSTVIALSVWNTQYLQQNSSFDVASSELTNGIINLLSQNFSAAVPLNAFKGNNITYALTLNGTLFLPSTNCLESQVVCIESKISTLSTISPGFIVYDIWLGNNILVLSVDTKIQVYTVINSIPSLISTISFAGCFTYPSVTCLFLAILSDGNTLICGSMATTASGIAEYFIFVGDLAGSVSDIFQISYEPEWMTVSQINGVHVYLYEGIGIYVFQILLGKITMVSYITTASLQVELQPITAEYFNSTMILVGDSSLGAVLVSSDGKKASTYIKIPAEYSTLMNLYTLQDSVIMLFYPGDGCKISTSNFSVVQNYYKLYSNGYIPGSMQGALDETENLLIYPVYHQPSTGYLRVLNLLTGDIYTELFITNSGPSQYYRRVLSGGNGIIYHDLSIGSNGLGLSTLKIREYVTVYLGMNKKEANTTMQLMGISGNYSLGIGSVEVWFEKNKSSNGGSSDNSELIGKWWFWVTIAAVIGAIAISGLVIYRKLRKSRMSDQESDSKAQINESFIDA